MFKKIILPLLLTLAFYGPASADPAAPRIYCSATRSFVTMDQAEDVLAREDVVMVGEIHDNPTCHQVELALLEGLFQRRPHVTLGLEMFERDVQSVLDAYLGGTMTEDAFLAQSRPWPNYLTDYRPLVDFARTHQLSVLGTNIPGSLALLCAKAGPAALERVPPHEMPWFARSTSAPEDRYWTLFTDAMGGHVGVHGSNPSGSDDAMHRYYQAQCLKDDTMAESIADYLTLLGPSHPLLVHVNGAFHTDYGLGTAARTRARLPGAQVAVVTMVAVDDDAPAEDASSYAEHGDYVILVPPVR